MIFASILSRLFWCTDSGAQILVQKITPPGSPKREADGDVIAKR